MKLKNILGIAAGSALLMAGLQSEAALLGLTPPPGSPEFGINFLGLDYAYNAGTGVGTLTGQGFTEIYNNGADTVAGFSGAFNFTANFSINNNQPSLLGGNFQINGDLDNDSPDDGTQLLLSGSLLAGAAGASWGFSDPVAGQAGSGDQFDFLFNVTLVDGDLAVDWGTGGGLVLDGNFGAPSANGRDWTQNFSNDPLDEGNANCFVPEPSSYAFGAVFVIFGSLLFQRCRRPMSSGNPLA